MEDEEVVDVPAHVLAVQQDAAGGALEAPDVPLFVQRDQRLSVGDLLVAAGATCSQKRNKFIRFFSWKAKNVPKFRSTDVVLLVFSADDIKVIRVEEEQEQSLPD